jgi:hypothetical protein
MGQQSQDFLGVDPGNDTRYGGSGADTLSPYGICAEGNTADCDDPNLTLADGADRPDHAELQALKQGVLSADMSRTVSTPWSTAIVTDTLNDTLFAPGHTLMTNQSTLGWTTSGEAFDSRAYHAKQNSTNPLDVNADSLITTLDALVLINKLNATWANQPLAGGMGSLANVFLDVNGDSSFTPIDVLWVINHLNAEAGGPEGETASKAYLPVSTRPPAIGTTPANIARNPSIPSAAAAGTSSLSAPLVTDHAQQVPTVRESRMVHRATESDDDDELDLTNWTELGWIPGQFPVPPGCQP